VHVLTVQVASSRHVSVGGTPLTPALSVSKGLPLARRSRSASWRIAATPHAKTDPAPISGAREKGRADKTLPLSERHFFAPSVRGRLSFRAVQP
jgi:hypothetical protein